MAGVGGSDFLDPGDDEPLAGRVAAFRAAAGVGLVGAGELDEMGVGPFVLEHLMAAAGSQGFQNVVVVDLKFKSRHSRFLPSLVLTWCVPGGASAPWGTQV